MSGMNATDAAEPVLSVESLRVQFDDFIAVKNVDISLGTSCLVGLVGPNGAGKTTLLRAIAGLQSPSRGAVKVMGQQVGAGDSAVLRHIGFTPDTPPVYEELTVAQFLRMIGKGYSLSAAEIDERMGFWLEKVWLSEKLNVKVKALSRGMRQRLGIARTMMPNPTVILLDEPSAGLDPAGRVQFRQLLMNLREQGKTLIVSSHILADMEEYCTHIAMMAAGQVVQFGTVAQIAAQAHDIDGHCRYTIVLAGPVAGIDRVLAAIEGVRRVQIDTDRISLEYFAARKQAAELLAQLVACQLPISSFSANAPGLEEAYLRSGIRQVD